MKTIIIATVLAASSFSLGSCTWEEGICMDDEVVIKGSASDFGGYCEKRTAGDPDCPGGEILRRIEDTGREDCIRNVVGHERDGLDPTRH